MSWTATSNAPVTLRMHAACMPLCMHAAYDRMQHAYDRRRSACRRRRPAFYVVDAEMQIVIIRREWTCQFSAYFYDRIFLFLVMTYFDTPIPRSAVVQ